MVQPMLTMQGHSTAKSRQLPCAEHFSTNSAHFPLSHPFVTYLQVDNAK